jgi:chitinase
MRGRPPAKVSVRSDDTLVANTNTQTKKVQAPLQAGWTNSKTTTPVAQVVDVVQQIQYQMSHGQSANKTTLFGYSGQTVVGVYIGSGIKDQNLASSVLERFNSDLQSKPVPENLFYQLCNGTRSAKYGFGILLNTKGAVSFVQDAVKTWRSGKCMAWHGDSSTGTTCTNFCTNSADRLSQWQHKNQR